MDEGLESFSSLYGCYDNLVVITMGWVEIWTLVLLIKENYAI